MCQYEYKSAVAVSRESELYNADFFRTLRATFPYPIVDARISAYTDLSPIPLVGSAQRLVLFSTYEGDNWETTFAQLCVLADAFTASGDIAGVNTEELTVFFIDFEGRHDRREEKVVTDSTERAIVKSQGVPPRALARSLKANGVENAVTVNIHSHLIDKIFQEAGLNHIPLATEPVFIAKLEELDYLTEEVLDELAICTTDIGGLKEASTTQQFIRHRRNADVPIAIIKKQRIPKGDGTSETIQEFAFGDVKDKRVLLIDDRSDSVKSIKGAVEVLEKQDVKEIVIYISHAVFADKEYYEVVRELLRKPKVKYIFVSNSLPMGEARITRDGGVDIPYVFVEEDGKKYKKELQILDIHPYLLEVTKTLLTSSSFEEARQLFEDKRLLLDMRNPFEIFEEITDTTFPRNKIVAIYDRGQFLDLPHSEADPFST